MIWHLVNSGEHTGSYNMEFDMDLAARCKSGEAYLRFYKWKPYCISLGANQSFSEIDLDKASAQGIDTVRRPTGGRAILHADEVTYSVILPADSGLTSHEIYERVSLAMVRGLRKYHTGLSGVELETIQPDFSKLLATPGGTACFASTAKSEVKFRGRKLIGSAQRKLNRSILQHGSLLCGDYHKNITRYLLLDQQGREAVADELNSNTTDLYEILGVPIDHDELVESLILGFTEEWNIHMTDYQGAC